MILDFSPVIISEVDLSSEVIVRCVVEYKDSRERTRVLHSDCVDEGVISMPSEKAV